jgi:hypothetical protein
MSLAFVSGKEKVANQSLFFSVAVLATLVSMVSAQPDIGQLYYEGRVVGYTVGSGSSTPSRGTRRPTCSRLQPKSRPSRVGVTSRSPAARRRTSSVQTNGEKLDDTEEPSERKRRRLDWCVAQAPGASGPARRTVVQRKNRGVAVPDARHGNRYPRTAIHVSKTVGILATSMAPAAVVTPHDENAVVYQCANA